MLAAKARDLARLRQIAGIVARHGYAHLAESLASGRAGRTSDAVQADASALVGAPARLRLLLQDLGPSFVKLGQVLSSRPDLVPSAFQLELARLQDDVSPLPFEQIHAQLVAAWHTDPDTHLAFVDPQPLATASIAQVHRARLHDGREVVLKVQRPGLEATVRADLDLLYLLARLLEATIEEAGVYRPVDIVAAFERAVLDELDFTAEARNARAIAANLESHPRILVPALVDALSSRTVLVMDFVAGTKITLADPEVHDRKALLATLLGFGAFALTKSGWGLAIPVSAVSIVAAVAISMLELFVAFLQAFVFMFLTAVFIGMMSHHGDHDHGHDHAHDHDHAHGHGHGAHAH